MFTGKLNFKVQIEEYHFISLIIVILTVRCDKDVLKY